MAHFNTCEQYDYNRMFRKDRLGCVDLQLRVPSTSQIVSYLEIGVRLMSMEFHVSGTAIRVRLPFAPLAEPLA